jgi:hypothetical protein
VLSAICVIYVVRGYLVWSISFLLGVGLTDLGDFGRYWGQDKAIVGVFNGPVIYANVRMILVFLARVVVLVKNLLLAILKTQFWTHCNQACPGAALWPGLVPAGWGVLGGRLLPSGEISRGKRPRLWVRNRPLSVPSDISADGNFKWHMVQRI